MSTPAPTTPGKFNGEIVTKYKSGRGGGQGEPVYWRWNGKEWGQIQTGPANGSRAVPLSEVEAEVREQKGGTNYERIGDPTTSGALRYPRNMIGSSSDYVLFTFYEYQPPFRDKNLADLRNSESPVGVYNYTATAKEFYKESTYKQIILYMPEDVSTGYKTNWTGKNFSNVGAEALSMAGSGDLGEGLQNAGKAITSGLDRLIPIAGAQAVTAAIQKVTGESISMDDILGSTRGVILNPNSELLFTGLDMRNFSLNYKLVPRNKPEADTIKEMISIFKKAMLPKFSNGDEFTFAGGNNVKNSFIRVPNVCRVSFMRGSKLNEDVAQYKMCALTQVDVNYTPDGTYATLKDGAMVAINLSLSFQETKLIFSEDIDQGY